jgi:hypothetical protein
LDRLQTAFVFKREQHHTEICMQICMQIFGVVYPKARPRRLRLLLVLLGLRCLVARLPHPSGRLPPLPAAARGRPLFMLEEGTVRLRGGGAADDGAGQPEEAPDDTSECARNETLRLDEALRVAVRDFNTSLAADLVRLPGIVGCAFICQ